ncbi:hypothetical protein AGMMS49545_12940 [Betaproteobacteria bacterium]|nr:hypothetical protein AGMMS49545_12940 [Betaproteobacteria bacterium]GHU45378.1 hypothetical protein AGMMS50289_16490 [Betaproteobacteria bacterium]
MKKAIFVCALIPLSFAVSASAAPAGNLEVTELGKISGVALACRQSTTMDRITEEKDRILPQTTDTTYDEIFKNALQQGLIQHQTSNAACPDEAAVKPRVDELFKQLRQALRR